MGKMEQKKMSASERSRFHDLDTKIVTGKQAWIEVGKSLIEIRDSKLYRESYATFKEYCEERHGFTSRRAFQLMEGAEIIGELADEANNCSLPTRESQTRELAKVPKDERAKVWEKAKNGNHVKAKDVRAAARDETSDVADAIDVGTTHHQRALDLLTQVVAILNELTGDGDGVSPICGGELIAGYRQQLSADIRNLRETIKSTRPHCICPYCLAAKKIARCDACKLLGWVTKAIYDEAPKDMKGSA